MTRLLRLLPIVPLALASCVVSTDDLRPKTDAQCAEQDPWTKACGPRCVSIEDPATGCYEYGCQPCPANGPPHTVPACDDTLACGFTCQVGWADCNGDVSAGVGISDGCEVLLAGDDELNCGECGRACVGCVSGVCAPVAQLSTGSDFPSGIVSQGGSVYFADSANGIRKLRAGGADVIAVASGYGLGELVRGQKAEELWAAGSMYMGGASVDYPLGWVLALQYLDLTGSPLAVQAVEAFLPETNESYIDGVAVSSSGTIVFTDSDWLDLFYVHSLGTDWLDLAAQRGRPKGVIAHRAGFYFGYPDGGGTLSWAEDLVGSVGPEEIVATYTGTPSRLAVHESGWYTNPILFWASEDDGSVHAMELDGGVPAIDLVQPPTGPAARMSITADADGVYWSNWSTGLVTGWRASDGAVLDLGFSAGPWAVTTLGTNVYWTDDVARKVYAVSK